MPNPIEAPTSFDLAASIISCMPPTFRADDGIIQKVIGEMALESRYEKLLSPLEYVYRSDGAYSSILDGNLTIIGENIGTIYGTLEKYRVTKTIRDELKKGNLSKYSPENQVRIGEVANLLARTLRKSS